MMSISLRRWKTGAKSFLFISMLVLAFTQIPALNTLVEQVELISLDLRYRNFNRTTAPSQQVIIVDFDEESLKKYASAYGRWPWPRRVHKELVSFIGEGNPSMVLFDILFTEPQKDSEDDQVLGEISALYKNTSHAALLLPETGIEGLDKTPFPKDRLFPNPVFWRVAPPSWFNDQKYKSIAMPNDAIWKQIANIHSVNVEPDADGIFRRVPLLFHYDQQWIPSLSFRGILSQTLSNKNKLYLNNQKLELWENEKTLARAIPLDPNGQVFLHYYANTKGFTQIRAGEILDSATAKESGNLAGITVNPEIFKNKVVLIGTSAMGLADLKVTPIGSQYPGVLLHATAISNVLNNDYLIEVPPETSVILTLFLVFLCYFSIFFVESFFIRNLLPPLLVVGVLTFNIYLFGQESLHVPLALPLLAGSLAILHGYVHMGIIETRQRKLIQGTLSRYVSPSVTQHLIEAGINPTAEVGAWREISILFSDIRGFTTLSETIAPDFLVRVLNEYLGEMTDLIFEYDGTLDKFIGDAVMAFWGAPIDDADHARKSVGTALRMVRAIEEFNSRNRKHGYPLLKVGIGVHTGKAIVGNIGSNKRLDYTIIGDNVNLASRIEGLTKEYGVSLLLSEPTYEIVKNHFLCRPIDVVVAKGKTKSIALYQALIERRPSPDIANLETLCFLFTDAFKLYQQGQFSWALESFRKILEKFPEDPPTLKYIERCEALALNPPLEWQGVFVATRK